MSEPHGHPEADAVETDLAALNSSEELDEDRLRVDPLEGGIEPPQRYPFSDLPSPTCGRRDDPDSPGRVTVLDRGRSAVRGRSPYGRWYERT